MKTNHHYDRRIQGVVALPGRVLALLSATVLLLAACNAQPSPGQMTPRAFVPAFSSGGNSAATGQAQPGQKLVLFIQGDHVPDSGYPHARVQDGGQHPESFTHLRADILEGDLKLGVDEFVLTRDNKIDGSALHNYALVVLGSNGRVLTQEEVAALTAYYASGGSVLTYADAQFGPDNWASDNGFLNSFGIEVFADNFQPAVDITDLSATHPIMAGVKDIRGEGISQFRVNATKRNSFLVLATCSPLTRSGCILPPADSSRVQKGDVVACVVTQENAAGGRLAGVCDRNFFQNGPGPGSDLDQVDNRAFARNLFRWLTKQ